jgi:hypothetical protein
MKKQFLSLGLMLLSGVAMAQYPTNGLVAYFPLDGNGNDAGPNGITPASFSAANAENRNTEADKSLEFVSANSNYIEYDMQTHGDLQLTGNFTIGFWIKPTPETQQGTYMLSIGDQIGLEFRKQSNNVSIRLHGYGGFGGGGTISSTGTVWTHIIVCRTDDALTLYYNNTQNSSSTGLSGIVGVYEPTHTLRLGSGQVGANMDAFMDDLFIYDRDLDATERGAIMAYGTCVPVTAGVTATAIGPICAGVPMDFTLSAANATEYSVTALNDWSNASVSGNVLTITPPAVPANEWPYHAFSMGSGNVCSTGPASTHAAVVIIAPDVFTITATVEMCAGSNYPMQLAPQVAITPTWTLPANWVQNGFIFTAGNSGTITAHRTNECFTTSVSIDREVSQGVPAAPVLVTGSPYPCKDEAELYEFTVDPGSVAHFINISGPWSTQVVSDTSLYITPQSWNSVPYNINAYSWNYCGNGATTVVPVSTNSGALGSYAWFEVEDGVLVADGYPGTITNQWMLEGQPIQGANGLTYTPTVSGNYNLQVQFTTPFTCAPVLAEEVYIDLGVVGIAAANEGTLSIYPNPATSVFTMDGLTAGSTITVVDAMGRTVSTTAVTAARMDVSVAALSTGIYMVQVMDGNNVRTARLAVNQ